MKKIAELNELNSKYKKEFSIKKEELTNSKKEINDLKNQKQLLIQESNNLKNKIKELKKDILVKYNKKSNNLKNLEEEYQNITEEKIFLIQIKYQILKKIILLI